MAFFGDVIGAFPQHFAGRVLDVGSLDINGGPHTLFTSAEYVGVDLSVGRNVTHVGRGELLTFPDGSFDVAMSSECFEHNPDWRPTLSNMVRMTREGGLIAFTASSTGRAEHGTSRSDNGAAAPLAVELGQEWYQNLTRRMVQRSVRAEEFESHFWVYLRGTADLLFLGLKAPAPEIDVDRLLAVESRWREISRTSKFPGGRVKRLILRISGDRGFRASGQMKRAATRFLRRDATSPSPPSGR